MYQKMSLVQKIGDEMCVLAVAETWRRVEHAPILIDMRNAHEVDKDLINKEAPAGSYLPGVVTRHFKLQL